MFELMLLASHFKSGDFFIDVLAPSLAGVIVLILILNSVLGHFGYKLF